MHTQWVKIHPRLLPGEISMGYAVGENLPMTFFFESRGEFSSRVYHAQKLDCGIFKIIFFTYILDFLSIRGKKEMQMKS